MKRRTWIALIAGLMSLTSCKDMIKAKGLAESATVDFHKQFNEEKYKDIYAASHADLKKVASEEKFLGLLEGVQRKLGKQVSSTEAGWRVNSYNMKTSMVLTQNTEFEHGKGVETFSYSVSDGTCTLQGYYINSQDMLLQ